MMGQNMPPLYPGQALPPPRMSPPGASTPATMSYPPPSYPPPSYPPPYPPAASPPPYPPPAAGRRSALAHNDFQLTFPAAASTLAAAPTPEGAAFRLTLRRGLAEFFSIPLDQVLYNGASFAPLRRRSMIETAAAAQRSTLLPTAASADGLITLLEQLVHQSCLGVEHVVSHTDDTSAASWDAVHQGESQDTLLDNTMDEVSADQAEQTITTLISMTTITPAPADASLLRSRSLLAVAMPAPSYPAQGGAPTPASYPGTYGGPTANVTCPSPANAGGAITALSDIAPYEYFLLAAPP
ncbi:MAG: hypothetical protein WDW38_001332 [Sanguina aurantia]